MTAATQTTDFWQDQADEPQICIDGRIDPQVHDAYWQSVYWAAPYHRHDLDYEQDYAPAYCVGYIGYAQYGGSFDDAEKSLCANWLRIKGASRLTIEEALQAIRAAWERAEQAELHVVEELDEVPAVYSYMTAAAGARQPAMATA